MFMNSFEKKTEEDRVLTAKVSICELNGIWQVYWTEPNGMGEPEQHQWFEGSGWSEMLTSFRGNVLEKMSEGYAPLLDGVTGDLQSMNGRAEFIQKLHYYSDINRNDAVFDQLRAWRRTQAGKEGKAPYMIATNRLLQVISTFLPQTHEELMQLPGFGQYKLNQYGSGILAVTGQVKREWSFPLNWVADKIDYVQYKLWLHRQQQAFEQRETERKNRKLAVLEAALKGSGLSELEASSIPRRDAVAIIEELDKEGYDVEPIINAELQSVSQEERERAMSAFLSVGDRYLKPVLNAVYGEEALKDINADRAYEWLRLLRIRYRREKETGAAKAG
ncbi:HRDC domain-containing protein [Paenibacillus alkalitolerans]|uniref:HRDC domain-containing protein n=1 Tax=Paenibacillus alkalitolerans TaxID=2799335 RepID=UPI002D7E79FE|nr:HRDC domain-containing protein [Paenibacillus alkalitolerans]